MINRPAEMTALNDKQLPVFNEIINTICQKALAVKYSNVLPTAETVAEGQMVIYDDGAGTKRLYMITGKKNLGYLNLT